MPIELGPLRGPPGQERRGIWRRIGDHLLSGPRWLGRCSAEFAGVDEIATGGGFIRELSSRLQGPADRVVSHPDGTIDLQATAFLMGVSEQALERRLEVRRRQTARLAWGAFAAAWGFLALWTWQMVALHWERGRLLGVVQFVPFCAVLFILAFRSAWQNWQLRTRRLGSVGEYLRTPDAFWPR